MRSTRHNHRAQQLEERADRMRHEPTPSEALLFESVRGGRLGVAFRRQVPVLGKYIADLLVPELRLIVEVDGGYHQQRAEADARRDRALARAGYTERHPPPDRHPLPTPWQLSPVESNT